MKCVLKCRLGEFNSILFCFRIGANGRWSCVCGNERSSSMKVEHFLDTEATVGSVIVSKSHSDYRIMKNGMGGACSTNARDERHMHDFGSGNLRKRDNLEDLRVDGWIILKLTFKKRNNGGVHFIRIAQVKNR